MPTFPWARTDVPTQRPSARKRGYTSTWERESKAFLGAHPLCALCFSVGRHTRATVVHHKKPHRGNQRLFWDRSNWMPACTPCHDGPLQSMEKGGIARLGCDVNGIPLEPEARKRWA